MAKTKTLRNDPTLAGQAAGRKRLFGDYHRYAVWPVHTRFDAVEWFVADAFLEDPVTGLPEVIRQAATEEAAVAGL